MQSLAERPGNHADVRQPALQFTFNLMTLLAFIIVLGIVVDTYGSESWRGALWIVTEFIGPGGSHRTGHFLEELKPLINSLRNRKEHQYD